MAKWLLIPSVFALSVWTLSCGGSSAGKPPDDPNVLAVFDGGQVTLADFDQAILDLPPQQRNHSENDSEDWQQRVVRNLALDRLLLAEAKSIGLTKDPAFEILVNTARRKLYTDHFLGDRGRGMAPITDQEMSAYFDAHRQDFEREAQRLAFNLFLRKEPGESREALFARADSLRKRVLAGESFHVLAEEFSDSETRHKKGLLGFISKGSLSSDLDRIIFSLETRVPSKPVLTKDGAHLFYVDQAVEPKRFSYDEVRFQIYQILESQRREGLIDQLLTEIPLPPDSFVPDADTLLQILNSRDPQAQVIRIGDFQLNLGQFQQVVSRERQVLAGALPPDFFLLTFKGIHFRERVFQHLKAIDFVPGENLENQLQQLLDRELIRFHLRRKLTAYLEDRLDILQSFYQNQINQFMSPPKVRLTRLTVPIADGGSDLMGFLESKRADLDEGSISLEDLAAQYQREVESTSPLAPSQLVKMDSNAARFAFRLDAGQHGPAYRFGELIAIFRVDERQMPQPLEFTAVHNQVLTEYLNKNGQKVFAEVSQKLLEEAHFQLFEERLKNMALPGIPPAADVAAGTGGN